MIVHVWMLSSMHCGFGDIFQLEVELEERYLPYLELDHEIWAERVSNYIERDVWWQSPEEIRSRRDLDKGSLSGLHIALDPGHIGGEWAEIEGRHFQIHPQDYAVREGELVLEVARLVRDELVQMGARVTLLRESYAPLNPRPPEAYLAEASRMVKLPADKSLASLLDYALALRRKIYRLSVVIGEIAERARRVNEEIRPDALLSLHINAAPWPKGVDGQPKYELVDSNHTHVLIFGCLSDAEVSAPRQQEQLVVKLTNRSGQIERELGEALGYSLGEATKLPPSEYEGRNAVSLKGHTPYLWARNLMLLRHVECPVVLLEPYIANSKAIYPRIQEALRKRELGHPLAEDDILVQYAGAIVAGLLQVYGPKAKD